MLDLKQYDYIIPVGSNCKIGSALRDVNLRKHSFPLDWGFMSSKSVYDAISDNLEELINPVFSTFGECDRWGYPFFNKKYKIQFCHFDGDINKINLETLQRRSQRLDS